MRTRFSLVISAASLAALSAGAFAQHDFNIDVADMAGSPTLGYGAALGPGGAGFWNVPVGGPPYAITLTNVAGTVTGVSTNVAAVGNGLGDFFFNHGGTTGDDEALMDDCQDIGNGGTIPPSETTWTFSGLNNATYDVIVYAWAPDSAAFVSFVSECGTGVATMVSGGWPGGFAPGTTHAELTVAVTGGTMAICVDAGGLGGNFASVNGFQIREGGPSSPGTPACFGDGSGAACPCGNNAPGQTGCLNGFGVGAELSGSGSASLANDTLVLTSDGVPFQPGLFFQGNNLIGGGSGIVFGDGLRCCAQNVIRIQVVNPGGGAGTTTVSTSVQISAHPQQNLTPGTTVCYQHWYRNPGNSPCGFNFNTSNALSVTWN